MLSCELTTVDKLTALYHRGKDIRLSVITQSLHVRRLTFRA